MIEVPAVPLRDGGSIPQVGFGVFRVLDDVVEAAVSSALKVGYRHIDTAMIYGNEAGTGRAIRESGIPREELFVTTKLWKDHLAPSEVRGQFDASLERMGLDYVDLYLIHWPVPSQDLYVETWRALQPLLEDGRARHIGVSNFHVEHLERLRNETGIVPVINQVELHPNLPQAELREYHREHGIVTQAWSPLAKGGELLQSQVLADIAARHGRTPAQVVLRWHIQLGNVIIPKSVHEDRMRENLDIFGFELSTQDFSEIATLNNGERTGTNPDSM